MEKYVWTARVILVSKETQKLPVKWKEPRVEMEQFNSTWRRNAMESLFGSYKRRNSDIYASKTMQSKSSGIFLIDQSLANANYTTSNLLTKEQMLSGVKSGFRHTEIPTFGAGVTGWTILNIFMAEFIGTGTLLFLGCMSIVIGANHMTICLAFGLAVATIIQTFGHISVAHLNPSVSIAAVILGKINAPMFVVYFIAQVLGATLGYGLLLGMTPESFIKGRTCCTVPNDELTTLQAMAAEYLATAILIFLLCGCWDKRNSDKHDSLALKFGFAITVLALAVGPYTGGSMNSARTLAPAIWHGEWKLHWIYWLSPLAAGLSVSAFYRLIFDNEVKAEYIVTREEIPLNQTSKQNESNA